MQNMENLKICTVCKLEKILINFVKDSRKKSGFGGQCKECNRIKKRMYLEKNKDYFKYTNKKYNDENKEKIKERKKEYREENKEKIKEQNKKYRNENKEKIYAKKNANDEQNRNERKYICSDCNTFYPNNNILIRHYKTHLHNFHAHFKCMNCDYNGVDKDECIKHTKITHGYDYNMFLNKIKKEQKNNL